MVSAPQWKFEWNLNTLVLLVGLAGGIMAWGWTLSEMQTGRMVNAGNIEKHEARLTALEMASRRLDNHELRLSVVERQATDAAVAMRAVEASMATVSADMRVVKEILQRLENANARRP